MTETTYLKVLEAQKKKVKDYEEVHFRKSIVADWSSVNISRDPQGITLNPKKLTRQSVAFSRDQAPMFFRCTEDLWLRPNYSRQDASKHLFDYPTGSFIVRNSEKARYAITVRLPTNDPPVSHFLIQPSPQGLLTIQGSSLPFLSLYDLLSFFCFNQSGGMPCLLKPPDPSHTVDLADLSDTSDSNEDEPADTSPDSTVMGDQLGGVASTEPKHSDQSEPNLVDMLLNHCNSQPGPATHVTPKPFNSPPSRRKAQPPPKPPRHDLSERCLTDNQRANIKTTMRRVSGLVEVDVDDLFEGVVPVHLGSKVSNLIQKFDPSGTSNIAATLKRRTLSQSNCPPTTPLPASVSAPSSPLPGTMKAKVIPPPPVPPRPIQGSVHAPPILPPRTPAPRVPPKPSGSCPPTIVPRKPLVLEKGVEPREEQRPPLPLPPLPPRPADMRNEAFAATADPITCRAPPTAELVTNGNGEERTAVEDTAVTNQVIKEQPSKPALRSKAAAWTKKLHWPKKPQKRIKKYILGIANDQSEDFSMQLSKHLAGMQRTLQSSQPQSYQQIFNDIRKFMDEMREVLLNDYRDGLTQCGMEQCANVEHVIETALQHCVVKPLSPRLYQLLQTHFDSNKSTASLQKGMDTSHLKTTEQMGIRKHLMVPSNKVIGEIGLLFSRMSKTYCAISKLEYLLEAVRLIYEHVHDIKHPKKPVTDLGADDFLPIFVWVLAQCQFTKAEIEAEYMWGLAHPSLFKGEGGYYLTTMTSAINVLKADSSEDHQSELKVYFEDQNTGQLSSAFYLQVVPTMSAAEICEVIADKHRISQPQNYALFTVINGQAKRIEGVDRPQEIKMKWQQDQDINKTPPRLFAYKRIVT